MKTIAFKSYAQLKKIKKPYILLVENQKRTALDKSRLVIPKKASCLWDYDNMSGPYRQKSCFLPSCRVNYKELVDMMRSYDIRQRLKPTEIILL